MKHSGVKEIAAVSRGTDFRWDESKMVAGKEIVYDITDTILKKLNVYTDAVFV
jgi:Skp family chaperone for outer membrane proteins